MINRKFLFILLLALGFAGGAFAQDKPAAPAPDKPAAAPAKKPATAAKTAATSAAPALVTPKDKASYAIGADVGNNLKEQGIDVNPTVLMRGLKDVLAGSKLALSDEEIRAALITLQVKAQQKQADKAKALGAENEKEGGAFLKENAKKEGVIVLPSGLQYKILKAGDGPKPTLNDTVVCNYRGTLTNGKEFDSSYKRGQPATFPVKGVIKGWTEALQLMPVGSKWQLVVPPELGYGARGAGPDIGPNAVLVFEVELMSIKSGEGK